jgi:hypothetical protein
VSVVGTILAMEDGGEHWTPQVSSSTALIALRFSRQQSNTY